MKTIAKLPQAFEFCFPHLDTLVLVEESPTGLLIRATRDTFSEERKVLFIHELAAEGFVSDSYRWFSGFPGTTWPSVWWRVDYSWLKQLSPETIPARKLLNRWIACAGLLLLLMLAILFAREPFRQPRPVLPPNPVVNALLYSTSG